MVFNMQNVRYIDECAWNDAFESVVLEFVHASGEKLAEAALVDFEAKLWKFEVFLPEKFQFEGRNPVGIVYSSAAAKRVAETILLNTILMRL